MTGTPPLLHVAWSLLRGRHRRRESIERFRDARLRELVHHAWRNVPYYRRLFDAHGVRPAEIRGAADLARLPISGKLDLRAEPIESIVAAGVDPRGLHTFRTSGSTGEPFTIRRTWLERRVQSLFFTSALQQLGVRAHWRIAHIGLFPSESPGWSAARLRRMVRLYGRYAIDLHAEPCEMLARLRQLRPHAIIGYPSTLARMAREMQRSRSAPLRPQLVITNSEVLTSGVRAQLTGAFAAPVRQWYGSLEMNLIAWSCRETSALHVSDDAVVLEVVRDGQPVREGERGEVVATNLHSFAMPFIRYRLGDIVTRGGDRCACGASFPTIESVQGRMFDHFPLPDGRVIHPYQLTNEHLMPRGWIGQIQLVQESIARLVLRIVPLADPDPRDVHDLTCALNAVLGAGVELQLHLVDEIPSDPGGKFRAYRSHVASRYDHVDWDATASQSSASERHER